MCITRGVIEMSDKKTKVNCRLITRGTEKVNAQVIDDLAVPDPEPDVGEQAIKEATEKDVKDEKDDKGEDDDQSGTS